MAASSSYIQTSLSIILSGMHEELGRTQLSQVKRNRVILRRLTRFIAELNSEFFYETLKDRLGENLNFLHKIPLSSEPLEDDWGRCTYFFSKIGPYILPVYQPGTPTFLSGVKKDSDLVAFHDNCQQNGALLGMGCGCFLADFVANLCFRYQENCAKFKLDSSNFHPDAYTTSLEWCLNKYFDKDRDTYGRLIEMKDLLLKIGDTNEVKCELLEPYFYAKDIEIYRGGERRASHLVLSPKEFSRILRKRDQSSTYQHLEMYFDAAPLESEQTSSFLNSEPWLIIRDDLFNSNGIFKDQTLATRWLKITFEEFEKQNQPIDTVRTTPALTTNASRVSYDVQQLENDYDLLRNEKLMEYFTKVQRGLESLFRSAVIADADIFAIRSPDLCKTIESIGDLVPETRTILQSLSSLIDSANQQALNRKLQELCNLSVRFPLLPELIARKITMMKRNYIMELNETGTTGLYSKLETILKANNRAKNWTIQEKLAFRDTKILEACCIRLLCQGEINPLTERDAHNVVNRIASDFKNTQSFIQLSHELSAVDEQPAKFKRQQPFVIPDSFFDHQKEHKFMKRKASNEDSSAYRERVKRYLMELSVDKLQHLLGSIDPSEEEFNPLLDLLLEVKRDKKKSCQIS